MAMTAPLGACGDDGDTTGAGGSGNGVATGTGGQATTGGNGGTTSAGGSSSGTATGSGETGGGGASTVQGTVPCAGEECAVGQVCCFDNTTTTQVRCDAPGACDAGQIELHCNHPDDCGPSSTCCSAFDGMVQTMVCQMTCDADEEYVMCSGPDQAACPMATNCSNAQAGAGYHYCAK